MAKSQQPIANSQQPIANNELLARDHRKAFRLALRITNNHADAEDVLQDALLKAYIKLSQFRGESSISTWLSSIVLRQAISTMRWRCSRKEIPLDAGSETIDDRASSRASMDPADNPESCVIQAELREMLARSIEDLEIKFRVVLVMREMGDFSIEELADVLELSIPAAKARLFQARKHLHRHLRKRLGK